MFIVVRNDILENGFWFCRCIVGYEKHFICIFWLLFILFVILLFKVMSKSMVIIINVTIIVMTIQPNIFGSEKAQKPRPVFFFLLFRTILRLLIPVTVTHVIIHIG